MSMSMMNILEGGDSAVVIMRISWMSHHKVQVMKDLIQVKMNLIQVETFWSGSIKCFNKFLNDGRDEQTLSSIKKPFRSSRTIFNNSDPISKEFRS